MKNRMQDVRNHLVAMMEQLGEDQVDERVLARARALSDLAQTYTNTVKVEIDARRLAGIEHRLPEPLSPHPLLAGGAS